MRFFLDNCLAPAFARALDALAEAAAYPSVVHSRSKFPPATTDVEWIRALGRERDWVIVSGDPRITRHRHEREAWVESGLTAFFLTKGWMNLKLWDQAWHLVRWWPMLVEQARRIRPGAGFFVPLKGRRLEQFPVSR